MLYFILVSCLYGNKITTTSTGDEIYSGLQKDSPETLSEESYGYFYEPTGDKVFELIYKPYLH